MTVMPLFIKGLKVRQELPICSLGPSEPSLPL